MKVDALSAGRSTIADVTDSRGRGARRPRHVHREPRPARRRRRHRALPAHAAHRRLTRPHDGPHRRGGRRALPATRGCSSCWSPRPIPAPRRSCCARSSSRPASSPDGTSRSATPPSGSTRDRSRSHAREHAEGRRRASRSAARARRRASTAVSCTHVVVARRPREAEMAKLVENTYRQVNIALVNELAILAHDLDVDIWEALRVAATKPFGYHARSGRGRASAATASRSTPRTCRGGPGSSSGYRDPLDRARERGQQPDARVRGLASATR